MSERQHITTADGRIIDVFFDTEGYISGSPCSCPVKEKKETTPTEQVAHPSEPHIGGGDKKVEKALKEIKKQIRQAKKNCPTCSPRKEATKEEEWDGTCALHGTHHIGVKCSAEKAYLGKIANQEALEDVDTIHYGPEYGTEPTKEAWEEDYWHYWRECHNCGLAAGGYLHCLHDGVQTNCRRCDERMPEANGDCECEFVLTEKEAKDLLASERARAIQEYRKSEGWDYVFTDAELKQFDQEARSEERARIAEEAEKQLNIMAEDCEHVGGECTCEPSALRALAIIREITHGK